MPTLIREGIIGSDSIADPRNSEYQDQAWGHSGCNFRV